MAQRRMTSLDVIDTDAFLDMGQGSQLLYFHLNARADDDGFVASPKKVMRNIGAAEDDMKVLYAKKFLIPFKDGVCVIKHWRINNFIRKDIYKETQYLDLKRTLFIRPNGAYTLTEDERAIPVPEGHFKLEDVAVTLTPRQLRIGKVREEKEKETANADFTLEVISDSTENERPTKVPRDPFVMSAAKVWHRKCMEEYGREPAGGVTKTMKIILEARKSLSDEQIKEKMMNWFSEEKLEEYEMMQITRCFSSFQIDKYLSNV